METGKAIRLRRLLPQDARGSVLVPLDDALISGPRGRLADTQSLLRDVLPYCDAVLGFPGLLRATADLGSTQLARVMNLTASTIHSHHTRKRVIGTVEDALRLGCDAVACHVNIGSNFEGEMIEALGKVCSRAATFNLPVIGIMYPRKEGLNDTDENHDQLASEDPDSYAELVAHAARVGAELGADIVKTRFTGSRDSFRRVLSAVHPTPVFVAGGPTTSDEVALKMADLALGAGARGISFGRNIYCRRRPGLFAQILYGLARGEYELEEAISLAKEDDDDTFGR